MELLQVGKHLWAYAKRCLEIWRTFWCMPASASRPNVNINNATSDWLTATAWPHLIGWCKKIRKADWLMMTSDAVENEWKYPICPAKNPALSGYKIKFLYIYLGKYATPSLRCCLRRYFARGSAIISLSLYAPRSKIRTSVSFHLSTVCGMKTLRYTVCVLYDDRAQSPLRYPKRARVHFSLFSANANQIIYHYLTLSDFTVYLHCCSGCSLLGVLPILLLSVLCHPRCS